MTDVTKLFDLKRYEDDERGFRRALAPVCLPPERVDDIVAARRRQAAPVTPLTGRMLAKALMECGDAEAAADVMLANGWRTIKPEWVAREKAEIRKAQDFWAAVDELDAGLPDFIHWCFRNRAALEALRKGLER